MSETAIATETLAGQLKRKMKEYGVTTAEVAERCTYGYGTTYNVVNEIGNPSIKARTAVFRAAVDLIFEARKQKRQDEAKESETLKSILDELNDSEPVRY